MIHLRTRPTRSGAETNPDASRPIGVQHSCTCLRQLQTSTIGLRTGQSLPTTAATAPLDGHSWRTSRLCHRRASTVGLRTSQSQPTTHGLYCALTTCDPSANPSSSPFIIHDCRTTRLHTLPPYLPAPHPALAYSLAPPPASTRDWFLLHLPTSFIDPRIHVSSTPLLLRILSMFLSLLRM
jgi:hypothetical protein